jgi:hypothetical protein
LAVDSSNFIYNGTTCCAGSGDREIEKFTPGTGTTATATRSTSAQDIAGINGVRSVAVDGAGNIWVGNELPGTGTTLTNGAYAISELSSAGTGTSATFTAISPGGIPGGGCATTSCPAGGYVKADFGTTRDLEVDPSGNVWVMNNGTEASQSNGLNISVVIGAAVPVVTPLSVGIKNGTLATKP